MKSAKVLMDPNCTIGVEGRDQPGYRVTADELVVGDWVNRPGGLVVEISKNGTLAQQATAHRASRSRVAHHPARVWVEFQDGTGMAYYPTHTFLLRSRPDWLLCLEGD